MSAHSVILGGSNAERLLKCPASYQEGLKARVVDVQSVYAERGTRLHAAIAHCMEFGITSKRLLDGFDWAFFSWPVNPEETLVLAAALHALDAIKEVYGGKFKTVAIEKSLPLPGVTAAFGSVDLILASKTTVIVVDWKFGTGVAVPILKTEGDEDVLNAQAAYYTICGRAKYARRFRGKTLVCAIIQPSLYPPADYTETDDAELDAYLDAFKAAYHEALGRNPRMAMGDHCRFAPCKATCPLWTGPVFTLADINLDAAALAASQEKPQGAPYGAFLGRAMDLAAFAEIWCEEVRRRAHAYLESGGEVSGYKLVPKRGIRQWNENEDVDLALAALGAHDEDIWSEPKLRSVAQVKKILKPRGIAVPESLYSVVSTGTTIAPADDSRPAVGSADLAPALRQALAKL